MLYCLFISFDKHMTGKLCPAVAFASVSTQAVMNGITLNIPDLPVRLQHTEQELYYDSTRVRYAWKFDTANNAVLEVGLEHYVEKKDPEEFISHIQANDENAEVVREDDRIYAYAAILPSDGIFLKGRSAYAVWSDPEYTVAVAYANDALTEEERLAEAKEVLASVVLTEFVAKKVAKKNQTG